MADAGAKPLDRLSQLAGIRFASIGPFALAPAQQLTHQRNARGRASGKQPSDRRRL
jgi:hypothetical protein